MSLRCPATRGRKWIRRGLPPSHGGGFERRAPAHPRHAFKATPGILRGHGPPERARRRPLGSAGIRSDTDAVPSDAAPASLQPCLPDRLRPERQGAAAHCARLAAGAPPGGGRRVTCHLDVRRFRPLPRASERTPARSGPRPPRHRRPPSARPGPPCARGGSSRCGRWRRPSPGPHRPRSARPTRS